MNPQQIDDSDTLKQSISQQTDAQKSPRIMLFDLSINGHHPAYIRHLIYYWHVNQLSGYLDIVVSPQFLQQHSEVVDFVTQEQVKNVRFVAIAPSLEATLKSRKSGWSRTQRAFQEWEILCKYAHDLKPDQCLIMYFDTCQFPLVFGKRPPCPISGIYFRPTFHYSHFGQSSSWKNKIQQWREKTLLSVILRRSYTRTLFSLDPFAVKYIHPVAPGKMIALPDPVEVTPVSGDRRAQLREQLGIEAERQIFLIFGALNGRKGIYQTLEALLQLPENLSQKMCLLLVGQANLQEQERMRSLKAAIAQSKPVQIITHFEFVSESEVQTYFSLADVVLAPYQKHIGMSGILVWAAATQKPVLSSDYGLMGEITRRHGLGITVDATCPEAITKGLAQFLTSKNGEVSDRNKMKAFADQNSAKHFAHTIFQELLKA